MCFITTPHSSAAQKRGSGSPAWGLTTSAGVAPLWAQEDSAKKAPESAGPRGLTATNLSDTITALTCADAAGIAAGRRDDAGASAPKKW